jgi:hypothetical protein
MSRPTLACRLGSLDDGDWEIGGTFLDLLDARHAALGARQGPGRSARLHRGFRNRPVRGGRFFVLDGAILWVASLGGRSLVGPPRRVSWKLAGHRRRVDLGAQRAGVRGRLGVNLLRRRADTFTEAYAWPRPNSAPTAGAST